MQEARGLHGQKVCVGTIRAGWVHGMTRAGPAPCRPSLGLSPRNTGTGQGHRRRSLAHGEKAWGGHPGSARCIQTHRPKCRLHAAT